jgi:hypothetical protein
MELLRNDAVAMEDFALHADGTEQADGPDITQVRYDNKQASHKNYYVVSLVFQITPVWIASSTVDRLAYLNGWIGTSAVVVVAVVMMEPIVLTFKFSSEITNGKLHGLTFWGWLALTHKQAAKTLRGARVSESEQKPNTRLESGFSKDPKSNAWKFEVPSATANKQIPTVFISSLVRCFQPTSQLLPRTTAHTTCLVNTYGQASKTRNLWYWADSPELKVLQQPQRCHVLIPLFRSWISLLTGLASAISAHPSVPIY